ncbi:DNA repair ATPase [Streptomyces sp. 1331.2]|uniref:DNA repair ATPase n=1 Tax=Streptomyces sp. 1331.2 TaxID=1938835 RepID=UPI000BCBBEC3|nr:DNA repair ATPase [Streptomyces sp. 1331.2]SOB81687.1 AAA domain (dynein-related subfamily) [Streptomyces sp. 1331.2]
MDALDDARLDAGTYEVLRDRLARAAAELADRARALNARRVEEFGGGELRLTGTGRLTTARACLPQDLTAVGGLLLLGTRPDTTAGDTTGGLGLHRPDLSPAPAEGTLLDDPRLRQDLADLRRYFRDARLERLRPVAGRLLAVFRTGPAATDVRVLRWRLDDGADDARPAYLDGRGERDHTPADGQQLPWTALTRDDQLPAGPGRPPRADLAGELHLGVDGGRLTLATPDGRELHHEPLAEALQTLADAQIAHARLGTLLLVRVRPYQEETVRHLVVHLPTGTVTRIDALGQACLRLPADQGVAFPGGCHLVDGTVRTFDQPVDGLVYERTVLSPNGEDVLYEFRSPADGRALLQPYNSVRQEAAAPLPCQGYALLADGTLIALRPAEDGPARLHPVQLWRTPFTSERFAARQPPGTGPLARIGNADLVRALADCLALARLAAAGADTPAGHRAVLAACTRTADRHHWLGQDGLGDLAAPLAEIRDTARRVIAEYEAVAQLTAHAARQTEEAAEHVEGLLRTARGETLADAAEWVDRLAGLRRAQGRVEALRDLPRADPQRIDALAAHLAEGLTEAAGRAVGQLAEPTAFAPHRRRAAELAEACAVIATAAEAEPLSGELTAQGEALQTVSELVGTLDLADATTRTAILDRLADVLGLLNRARAALTVRRRELRTREAAAEFAAETALLGQAATAALAAADTPEACDDQLGRLLLRIEQLETRFADADPALGEHLAQRRTELHDALTARRQHLLEERARRADRLAASAERILDTLHRRLTALSTTAEIDAALAADPTAVKLRDLAAQLTALGDRVRAEELTGRLRAARGRAHRALRDRAELAGDGPGTLRLGRHLFGVTTQRPELALVPWRGRPAFTLTGTAYRSPVTDPAFAATERYWDRPLPSETPGLYRAEYLAASLLLAAAPGTLAADADPAELLEHVRRAAEQRPDEGYQRGVHDHDAALLLHALLRLDAEAGLLRHPARARAAAQLYWAHGADARQRLLWHTRARSLGLAREAFGGAPAPQAQAALDALAAELSAAVAEFVPDAAGSETVGSPAAGPYLVAELASTAPAFAYSAGAAALLDKFRAAPESAGLTEALAALPDEPALLPVRRQLAAAWLAAGAADAEPGDLAEAAAALLCPSLPRRPVEGAVGTRVTGLLGDHPRLTGGTLDLRLDELLCRVREFEAVEAPGHRAYQRLRGDLLAAEHARLRLDQYRPAPLNGFVRNRLIDQVYLPLIGDNLAKQLGTADSGGPVDRSGLLLLVSPPGYGKTTLVEYLAERLGLLLVTVSGPALGHRVTSLDPAEAPDATSRREVEKLNFALHAGDNVLLYLDDVQHTSPEFLQRFIPLCDAQRRIDGVQDGEAREWDLRGRRFAVVMAANPYTESGRLFRLPDMLANRADVWNLGDAVAGRQDLFALSFVENALPANAHLAPLATAERADLDTLLARAAGTPGGQLTGAWPAAETERMTAVLAGLLHLRSTVLAVNRAYLDSAAQDDRTRTEPPFLLQGSYRNMAKLAQRLDPALTRPELDALLTDHYRAEAQPLGADAEAQLLKLAELRGTLTPEQAKRWEELKRTWRG